MAIYYYTVGPLAYRNEIYTVTFTFYNFSQRHCFSNLAISHQISTNKAMYLLCLKWLYKANTDVFAEFIINYYGVSISYSGLFHIEHLVDV